MGNSKPNSKGGERAERRRTGRAIESAQVAGQTPVRDPFTNLGVKRPGEVGTKELLLKIGILSTQIDLKDEYISNLVARLDQVVAALETKEEETEATTPEDVSEGEAAE